MNRRAAILTPLALIFALAACEPEEKVEESSAEFESWLEKQGLTPLNEAQATALFSGKTLRGRYEDMGNGNPGRWIEFYSSGGVSVFQPTAEQSPKRRLVYFGTWWSESDRTCFSYPEGKFDCYRVYQDSEWIYFIRTLDHPGRPAGSLAVAADRIEEGNTENYPHVTN